MGAGNSWPVGHGLLSEGLGRLAGAQCTSDEEMSNE